MTWLFVRASSLFAFRVAIVRIRFVWSRTPRGAARFLLYKHSESFRPRLAIIAVFERISGFRLPHSTNARFSLFFSCTMCDKQAVLCRFDKSGGMYLSGTILGMSENGVEVRNNVTGESVLVDCPDVESLEPSALDVVLDVVPSGKLVNIGCPVLVPVTGVQGAFVKGRIEDKTYKPLKAKVAFLDGSESAWFSREDTRMMQCPILYHEMNAGINDNQGEEEEDKDDVVVTKSAQRKRKNQSPTSQSKYKKGDIVRLPHGVQKKVSTS